MDPDNESSEPDRKHSPSTRQIIRALNHALSDLNHESFPNYAATWQDDIRCAASHIADANKEMASYLLMLDAETGGRRRAR